MSLQVEKLIQLPEQFQHFELTMAGNNAVARTVRKVHVTDELVTCDACAVQVDDIWKASFSLYSNDEGHATYHAKAELDALAARTFPSAQLAMEAALSSLDDGFDTLAAAREYDGEDYDGSDT
ncbi:hypothetical protein F6X40_09285 [Paraburkholderia sp. UCT31]|uniref:hypothetical protein n=1 Tax=Paraburkholderia sp. UCT31 TaxID=2615209 RepID=UPI0016566CAE|nr:hypothetical protein [Paraburkholderia sp. UCT31]MBC8737000.1 hypothetical protein [Paraburkholderia sp. UCT31]